MQPSMNNLPPSINMASFASLAGMDPSIVGMMELERQYGLNPLAGMVPNNSAASIHAPTYHLPSFPPQPYTMGTTNLIQQSMPPGMRGGMRGMHPGVRGINPGARGNNPRLRGMPPLTRGGVTRGGPRGGRGAMHNLIDIADSPPASPAKNPALDKLKACGISVSVQKTPEIPKGLNLPAGITICHAPTGYNGGSRNVKSSPTEPSSSKRTSFEKTSPSQKVSLTPNIAGALATAAVPDNGPKTKVELDLSSSQMAALRMLGLL